MDKLRAAAWPAIEAHAALSPLVGELRAMLDATGYRALQAMILRHAFLIELAKPPKFETTKYGVRWDQRLACDPRGSSFEDCVEICRHLLASLPPWLGSAEHTEAFALFRNQRLFAYEAPLDYSTVPSREDGAARLHCPGNLVWTCTDTMSRTLRLRKYLTSSTTSPDSAFFKKVLNAKIKVKVYLTDRALTGAYKTNREKRWEVHPFSVQFATRRAAMEIEHVLIEQLCAFHGFPQDARRRLEEQGILPAMGDVFRCPVTLQPLSFDEFETELRNPIHGKSRFQIGHLNPLRLDVRLPGAWGHSANNISWISEDGNRIQGNVSLNQVRNLLKMIAENYRSEGIT
mgnify:CR=1 FL=1